MRIRTSPLSIVALSAVVVIAPGVLGAARATQEPVRVPASEPSVGRAADDDLVLLRREVAEDMVVDWLGPASSTGQAGSSGAPGSPPSPAGTDEAPGAPSGEAQPDGDASETEAADAPEAQTPTGSARSGGGSGYALFSTSVRWVPTGYTIRLAGDDRRVEQYRDRFETAARAVSAATGVRVQVGAGTASSPLPGRGEVTVVVGASPCGSGTAGCGGPTLASSEVRSGRVWLDPSALSLSAPDRANLAAHELGHALGLQHYAPDFADGRQAMYPVLSGTVTYRSGDTAGLRYLAGRFDPPAGELSSPSYAAGLVRVSGTLRSGTRVSVTVDGQAHAVDAPGGAFAVQIPADAGSHEICARALDPQVGFRPALGCSSLTAPGTPFGHLDPGADDVATVPISGWAADPQTASPVEIEVRRNGALVARFDAALHRDDVQPADYGTDHGFRLDVPAVAGTNEICVRVLGVGGGGSFDLGCRRVDHPVDPVGVFESVPPDATDVEVPPVLGEVDLLAGGVAVHARAAASAVDVAVRIGAGDR